MGEEEVVVPGTRTQERRRGRGFNSHLWNVLTPECESNKCYTHNTLIRRVTAMNVQVHSKNIILLSLNKKMDSSARFGSKSLIFSLMCLSICATCAISMQHIVNVLVINANTHLI